MECMNRRIPRELVNADLAVRRYGDLGSRWLDGMWQADPLADARSRERALRAELQQATAELQDTEARLALADDRLAFDRGQLETARRQLLWLMLAVLVWFLVVRTRFYRRTER